MSRTNPEGWIEQIRGRTKVVTSILKVAEWTAEFGEHTASPSREVLNPEPSPVRRAELALAIIEEGPRRYSLEWRGPTDDTSGRSSHTSLAEAIAAADESFGIPADAWADLPSPEQQ